MGYVSPSDRTLRWSIAGRQRHASPEFQSRRPTAVEIRNHQALARSPPQGSNETQAANTASGQQLDSNC